MDFFKFLTWTQKFGRPEHHCIWEWNWKCTFCQWTFIRTARSFGDILFDDWQKCWQDRSILRGKQWNVLHKRGSGVRRKGCTPTVLRIRARLQTLDPDSFCNDNGNSYLTSVTKARLFHPHLGMPSGRWRQLNENCEKYKGGRGHVLIIIVCRKNSILFKDTLRYWPVLLFRK